MEILKAILLGIVQGLTEFLPVSSSGHLALVQYILGNDFSADQNLMMTIVLHFGTALATILVLRKEILAIISKFSKKDEDGFEFPIKIFISMLPAGLIGYFFQDQLAALFDKKITLVGICLIATGILLFIADRIKASKKKISYKNALIIGIAQAIALLPGISRSGATISSALVLGVDRERSANFSFLMVLPLIFLKIGDDLLHWRYASLEPSMMWTLLVGLIASFITGVLACRWMIKIVKRGKLHYFSYYTWLIGLMAILLPWIL